MIMMMMVIVRRTKRRGKPTIKNLPPTTGIIIRATSIYDSGLRCPWHTSISMLGDDI